MIMMIMIIIIRRKRSSSRTGIINNMFTPQKTSTKTRTELYNTLALPALLYGSEKLNH